MSGSERAVKEKLLWNVKKEVRAVAAAAGGYFAQGGNGERCPPSGLRSASGAGGSLLSEPRLNDRAWEERGAPAPPGRTNEKHSARAQRAPPGPWKQEMVTLRRRVHWFKRD